MKNVTFINLQKEKYISVFFQRIITSTLQNKRISTVLCLFSVLQLTSAAFSLSEIDLTPYNGRVSLCPTHESSVAGSDTCVCEAGYYRSSGTCIVCAQSEFKAAIGDQPCTPCGNNFDSLPGAIAQTECLCLPGYTLNGASCEPCAGNKYKPFTSNVACRDCPDNLQNSGGGTALTSCECSPGYSGVHGGPCVACVKGTFKLNPGSAACQSCLSDSYMASTAATECTGCPPDTSTYSATGSDNMADCKCTEGLQSTGPGTCETCEANFYCPGQNVKTACPVPGGLSQAGSNAFDDCYCAAGYYLNGATCVTCTPDFYCPAATTLATRQPCPANSFAPAGAEGEDECVCDPGYRVS